MSSNTSFISFLDGISADYCSKKTESSNENKPSSSKKPSTQTNKPSSLPENKNQKQPEPKQEPKTQTNQKQEFSFISVLSYLSDIFFSLKSLFPFS